MKCVFIKFFKKNMRVNKVIKMELVSNSPSPTVEPGVSTSPPQIDTPSKQQYETELPTKDFTKPAVPIAAPDMKTMGPSKHNGLPVYYAANMKADIVGANKMGSKWQSVAILTSATNPAIAFVDTVSNLKNVNSSSDQTRLIVVGDVPVVDIEGKRKDVVLPQSLAQFIGDQAGTVTIPINGDNKIPLFTRVKQTKEYMGGEDESTYIAVATIFFLIIAIFVTYSKLM